MRACVYAYARVRVARICARARGATFVPRRDGARARAHAFFFPFSASIFDPISVEKREMDDDNLFLPATRREWIFARFPRSPACGWTEIINGVRGSRERGRGAG